MVDNNLAQKVHVSISDYLRWAPKCYGKKYYFI